MKTFHFTVSSPNLSDDSIIGRVEPALIHPSGYYYKIIYAWDYSKVDGLETHNQAPTFTYFHIKFTVRFYSFGTISVLERIETMHMMYNRLFVQIQLDPWHLLLRLSGLGSISSSPSKLTEQRAKVGGS